MTVTTYDIQDLVSATSTPRRTIYFYVQQGVLPPPEGAGLAARYNEDHLLRLRLIPVLRQQGLRLDEIRARFAQMSTEEMRQALVAAEAQTPQPAPAPKAIHDLPARNYPGPAVGWGEQRYEHYPFPGGISLVVPENLGPIERQKVQLLLQAARQIFSGAPVIYDMDRQPPRASAASQNSTPSDGATGSTGSGENGSHSPEEK